MAGRGPIDRPGESKVALLSNRRYNIVASKRIGRSGGKWPKPREGCQSQFSRTAFRQPSLGIGHGRGGALDPNYTAGLEPRPMSLMGAEPYQSLPDWQTPIRAAAVKAIAPPQRRHNSR